MTTRTVEWPVPPALGTGAPQAEGLRERKKRLMRQQLSDTATQMFLEQGFDAVRVTEIAEACGVSEKTVFNYFPTKESLILDRLEATVASLRTGLAEPEVPPVQAALRILDGELGAMTSWLAAQDDPVQAGVNGPALRRPDRGHSVIAGSSERHDGPVHRRGRRDPGRTRRPEPGGPGAADHGHRPARPVAHPVPGPVEVPGRHPHPRAGPPGGDRRRPPGRPAHQHRTELAHGLHARPGPAPGHHRHRARAAVNGSVRPGGLVQRFGGLPSWEFGGLPSWEAVFPASRLGLV